MDCNWMVNGANGSPKYTCSCQLRNFTACWRIVPSFHPPRVVREIPSGSERDPMSLLRIIVCRADVKGTPPTYIHWSVLLVAGSLVVGCSQ
jgi:hypothetical protein